MEKDQKQSLLELCKHVFPTNRDPEILEIKAITNGWESELYSFTIEYGPSESRSRRGLVIRLYPGLGNESKVANEFRGMSRMHELGYPVPEVHYLGIQSSFSAKPFILMEQIVGDSMWSIWPGGSINQAEELTNQFCRLMVRLHEVDWHQYASDKRKFAADPFIFVDDWLKEGSESVQRFDLPGFKPVLDWVIDQRERMACHRPSVIHGDFHPNNILLQSDNSAVVIDWSGFRVGDARFDLAWTLVLVSGYEGIAWRDRLLNVYMDLSDHPVDAIECFEVAACARRLFSICASLLFGPESLGMRPGAQKLIRQQLYAARINYDMLFERTGIRISEVETLCS